jgi:hypothetical protein
MHLLRSILQRYINGFRIHRLSSRRQVLAQTRSYDLSFHAYDLSFHADPVSCMELIRIACAAVPNRGADTLAKSWTDSLKVGATCYGLAATGGARPTALPHCTRSLILSVQCRSALCGITGLSKRRLWWANERRCLEIQGEPVSL